MNIELWTRSSPNSAPHVPRRSVLLGWLVAYSPVLFCLGVLAAYFKAVAPVLNGVNQVSESFRAEGADPTKLGELGAALALFGLAGMPVIVGCGVMSFLLLISFISACQFAQQTGRWSLNDAVRVRIIVLLVALAVYFLGRLAEIDVRVWLLVLLAACVYGIDLGSAFDRPGTLLLGGIGFAILVVGGLLFGAIGVPAIIGDSFREISSLGMKLFILMSPSIVVSFLYFLVIRKSV